MKFKCRAESAEFTMYNAAHFAKNTIKTCFSRGLCKKTVNSANFHKNIAPLWAGM